MVEYKNRKTPMRTYTELCDAYLKGMETFKVDIGGVRDIGNRLCKALETFMQTPDQSVGFVTWPPEDTDKEPMLPSVFPGTRYSGSALGLDGFYRMYLAVTLGIGVSNADPMQVVVPIEVKHEQEDVFKVGIMGKKTRWIVNKENLRQIEEVAEHIYDYLHLSLSSGRLGPLDKVHSLITPIDLTLD